MNYPPLTLEVGLTFRLAGEVVQVHAVAGETVTMLRRSCADRPESWPTWLLMVLVVKHVAFVGKVEPLPEVVRFKPIELEGEEAVRVGRLAPAQQLVGKDVYSLKLPTQPLAEPVKTTALPAAPAALPMLAPPRHTQSSAYFQLSPPDEVIELDDLVP